MQVDLGKFIPLSLVDDEGHDEILLRCQFGNRRHDPEIGIALLQVELPQLLLVIGLAVGVVGVVGGE